MSNTKQIVSEIYMCLYQYFGPRNWWPGDTTLEIVIGAILTQAVAWKNVKTAIDNLKDAELLHSEKLLEIDEEQLAYYIKPALYHRQKAKKIKCFMNYFSNNYNCDFGLMFKEEPLKLRKELLSIWGIGPETADSILLYAGNIRIFVVDAYTKRIFSRIGLVKENISYDDLQLFFHTHVEPDVKIYNEYHALIVGLGANLCKKNNPKCNKCPLFNMCKYSKVFKQE